MTPSSGGAVDECFRCKHVNLVERSNVPGEFEYLFAPYSVSVAPYDRVLLARATFRRSKLAPYPVGLRGHCRALCGQCHARAPAQSHAVGRRGQRVRARRPAARAVVLDLVLTKQKQDIDCRLNTHRRASVRGACSVAATRGESTWRRRVCHYCFFCLL